MVAKLAGCEGAVQNGQISSIPFEIFANLFWGLHIQLPPDDLLVMSCRATRVSRH